MFHHRILYTSLFPPQKLHPLIILNLTALTIPNDQELRELHKTPDVVVVTKRRRLEWLGHVIRMVQRRVAKT
jgi:hypothetical protein